MKFLQIAALIATFLALRALCAPAQKSLPDPITPATKIDVDGRRKIVSGSLWCWINNGFTDLLPTPIRSQPIYKYCYYQPMRTVNDGKRNALNLGQDYYEEEDAYIDQLFEIAGEGANVVTAPEETTHLVSNTTVRHHWCRTAGCNIPRSYLMFLEYNMRMNATEKMAVQVEIALQNLEI